MLNSLRRDTVLNLFGNAIPLLLAIITIPNLMERLGTDAFGLLTLIWALVGYFGIFDLGVGRALTYEVRLAISSRQSSDLMGVIRAGLIITLVTGLIGGLIVGSFVAIFATKWFDVSGSLGESARTVFEITAFAILPTTLTSGLRGALEGFGRFLESNVVRGLVGSFMFLAPYVAVTIGNGGLETAAVYLMVARYLILILAVFWLRSFIFVKSKNILHYFRRIFNFGIWVTLSGLISPLMVYGDRFFVSAAVGVERLAYYAVPQEGLQRLLILPGALTSALMPRMVGKHDLQELIPIYKKNLGRIAFFMMAVCLLGALLAHPLLSVWLTPAFADEAAQPLLILLVGLWFNSLAQLPNTVMYAVGKPKTVALIHLSELVGYVVLVSTLASRFGVEGAAVAWSMRVIVDFFLLDYLARKEMIKC